MADVLTTILATYRPTSPAEAADVAELRAAVAAGEVWDRAAPLHVTGSALVVHPSSGQVLLRWHPALAGWYQVGGHAEAAERDPWVVALREAAEETGLVDLHPVGGTEPVQVVVVPVPARSGEPAHRHADIRYLLATGHPERARPEAGTSPLRWCTPDDASALVTGDDLRDLVARAVAALG